MACTCGVLCDRQLWSTEREVAGRWGQVSGMGQRGRRVCAWLKRLFPESVGIMSSWFCFFWKVK